jgi:integrase
LGGDTVLLRVTVVALEPSESCLFKVYFGETFNPPTLLGKGYMPALAIKTILLGQLPYEFLARRALQSKGNTKDRTLKNYKRIAEYWLDHLGNIPIGEIKRADVSEILQDKKTMPRRGELVVGDYSYHKVFDRAVERASIEAKPERLTFHGLTHTYATWKLRDGTDMRTLAYLLGHKTLAMVMRYAHPDLERARGMPRLEHKAGGMITLRSPNENAEEEKSNADKALQR